MVCQLRRTISPLGRFERLFDAVKRPDETRLIEMSSAGRQGIAVSETDSIADFFQGLHSHRPIVAALEVGEANPQAADAFRKLGAEYTFFRTRGDVPSHWVERFPDFRFCRGDLSAFSSSNSDRFDVVHWTSVGADSTDLSALSSIVPSLRNHGILIAVIKSCRANGSDRQWPALRLALESAGLRVCRRTRSQTGLDLITASRP